MIVEEVIYDLRQSHSVLEIKCDEEYNFLFVLKLYNEQRLWEITFSKEKEDIKIKKEYNYATSFNVKTKPDGEDGELETIFCSVEDEKSKNILLDHVKLMTRETYSEIPEKIEKIEKFISKKDHKEINFNEDQKYFEGDISNDIKIKLEINGEQIFKKEKRRMMIAIQRKFSEIVVKIDEKEKHKYLEEIYKKKLEDPKLKLKLLLAE